MENKDRLGGFAIYSVVILFFFIAVAARFLAISHQLTLDWSVYDKVLVEYFRTTSRAQIFVVQFVSIFSYAALIPFFAKTNMGTFLSAFLLLTLISILRYAIPVFVVSVVGDLLVLLVIAVAARAAYFPKIGLALSVPISLFLVPTGLWVLVSAMFRT